MFPFCWFCAGRGLLGDAICWFAFQCAALFRATVLALRERPIPAAFAPLGVYIYAVGSESCRNRLTLEGSARLRPKTKPRVAPLVEFVAERRTRRYAPQCFVGGIPPSRLATCTTAHPPNRAVACHSARHSARRSASSLHVNPLQVIPTAITLMFKRGLSRRGKIMV